MLNYQLSGPLVENIRRRCLCHIVRELQASLAPEFGRAKVAGGEAIDRQERRSLLITGLLSLRIPNQNWQSFPGQNEGLSPTGGPEFPENARLYGIIDTIIPAQ